MAEVLKTVNKVLRIIFIGVVGIAAVVKAFDVKPKAEKIVINNEDEFVTSEFDDIW